MGAGKVQRRGENYRRQIPDLEREIEEGSSPSKIPWRTKVASGQSGTSFYKSKELP